MATNAAGIQVALALGLMALFFHGTMAQSGCTTTLMGLNPCLNYVSGNSSTPSSTCCSRLAGVVQSQPQCLCVLVNNAGSSTQYNINQTLALALPGACKVQTPPLSRCSALAPTTSPASTSATPADDTPTTTPSSPTNNIPSGTAGVGGGSKATPSQPQAGDGIDVRASLRFGLLLLLMASYTFVA